MKVKIKMNVPKPPTGMPGVTFFGSCYKWKDVFYRMGEEYTVKKEDFNPAIMVDLSPRKKAVPKVEKETEAEVELNTSDEISEEIKLPTGDTPILIKTSDEVPIETQEKRKHQKK